MGNQTKPAQNQLNPAPKSIKAAPSKTALRSMFDNLDKMAPEHHATNKNNTAQTAYKNKNHSNTQSACKETTKAQDAPRTMPNNQTRPAQNQPNQTPKHIKATSSKTAYKSVKHGNQHDNQHDNQQGAQSVKVEDTAQTGIEDPSGLDRAITWMERMGWLKEGGLGRDLDGIVEPVKAVVNIGKRGIGLGARTPKCKCCCMCTKPLAKDRYKPKPTEDIKDCTICTGGVEKFEVNKENDFSVVLLDNGGYCAKLRLPSAFQSDING